MANIKLFNINGKVKELKSGTVTLEKELQTIIENNMQTFFGVTFLASEFQTTDGGRMDSLGIDENNCPVIFEYKRSVNDSVINQGLFYLNWLIDHKDSFKVLVIDKIGSTTAKKIDWSMPRVICVANDFTKYDVSAIKQMNKNISLIRYKKFDNSLLMLEQVNENIIKAVSSIKTTKTSSSRYEDKTFNERYNEISVSLRNLYEDIKNYIISFGDDVSENTMKFYVAFKKIKNIICICLNKDKLLLYLKLNPSTLTEEKGFTRNVSKINHWGTGDVEITIKNQVDFLKAKNLIDRAYNEN